MSVAILLFLTLFPSLILSHHYLRPVCFSLVCILAAWEVISRKRLCAIRFGYIEGLLALILCCLLAALLFNPKPVAIFVSVPRFLVFTELFLIYLFICTALNDKDMVNNISRGQSFKQNLIWIVAISAFFQIGIGLYQLLILREYRVEAHLSNPNYFAAFIGSAFCFIMPAVYSRKFISKSKVGPLLLAGALSFLPLFILASRSRGGAAAFCITFALLVWIKKGFLKTVGAISVIVLLLVLIPNPLYDRISKLTPSENQFSRSFIWKVDVANILSNPMGLGPEMGKYYLPSKAFEMGDIQELAFKKQYDPAHNILLETGLEGGVLALTTLIFLFINIIMRGKNLWAAAKKDPILLGAFLGLFLLGVHSQIEPLERSVFIGILCVIFLAFFRTYPSGSDQTLLKPKLFIYTIFQRFCMIVLVFIVVSSFAWAASSYIYTCALTAKKENAHKNDVDKYLEYSTILCPWNFNPLFFKFEEEFRRFKEKPTIDSFYKANDLIIQVLDIHPLFAYFHIQHGRLFNNIPPDLEKYIPNKNLAMEKAFERAFELDPLNLSNRYSNLISLYFPDRPEQFLKHTEIFNKINPRLAKLTFLRGICMKKLGRQEDAIQELIRSLNDYNVNCILVNVFKDISKIKAFCELSNEGYEVAKVKRLIESIQKQLLKIRRNAGD